MSPKYLPVRLIMLMALLSLLVVDRQALYAQEESVVATQSFLISPDPNVVSAAGGNAESCEVVAELRWYNRLKRVKVLYHWSQCATPQNIQWELESIIAASGQFSTTAATGEYEAYRQTWEQLQPGDQFTLRTWINQQRQYDILTQFQASAPVWPRIYTRSDAAGNCFKFTGHNDPWGVFTAGDVTYKFELNTLDWETVWLQGPQQPTVNWHVEFYYDEALTKLRTEYWFNNVANPCFAPPATPTETVTPTPTETPSPTPTPTVTETPTLTVTPTPTTDVTGVGAPDPVATNEPTDEEITDEPTARIPRLFLPLLGAYGR